MVFDQWCLTITSPLMYVNTSISVRPIYPNTLFVGRLHQPIREIRELVPQVPEEDLFRPKRAQVEARTTSQAPPKH
jgi:hypothetical protein